MFNILGRVPRNILARLRKKNERINFVVQLENMFEVYWSFHQKYMRLFIPVLIRSVDRFMPLSSVWEDFDNSKPYQLNDRRVWLAQTTYNQSSHQVRSNKTPSSVCTTIESPLIISVADIQGNCFNVPNLFFRKTLNFLNFLF